MHQFALHALLVPTRIQQVVSDPPSARAIGNLKCRALPPIPLGSNSKSQRQETRAMSNALRHTALHIFTATDLPLLLAGATSPAFCEPCPAGSYYNAAGSPTDLCFLLSKIHIITNCQRVPLTMHWEKAWLKPRNLKYW